MFQQIQLADGSLVVGSLAFLVTFSIFLMVVIGTLRCPRQTIEKMANLPWEKIRKP